MRSQAFENEIGIGVDADRGGDRHRAAHDLFGVEFGRQQRARRGERVIAARADRGRRAVLVRFRFEHVARAGQHEAGRLVGDEQHRLEAAQIAVGAPVLAEFDAGARQLAGKLLDLLFQPLEQGQRVGGRAGETGDDLAFGETAHLARVALHDRLADADLAVAADDDFAALAHHQDGRRMPAGQARRVRVGHRRFIPRAIGGQGPDL